MSRPAKYGGGCDTSGLGAALLADGVQAGEGSSPLVSVGGFPLGTGAAIDGGDSEASPSLSIYQSFEGEAMCDYSVSRGPESPLAALPSSD
eukprot:IDg12912t1